MPVELPLGPSRQRPATIGVAFLLLSCGPEQGSSSTASGSSMGHEAGTSTSGEHPTPDMKLGGSAIHLSSKGSSTCVQLATGPVRCWGSYDNGTGHAHIGDDELPDSVPPVPVF